MIGTILALLGKKGRNFLWNGLGNIWNRYTGSGLTTAEQETNQFNAEQAQAQRDWEQSMRDTSFQAQVADMRKAGLNTALMYGGVGSSGASVPSGASASGVTPSNGDIGSIFSSLMDMALLGAQIKNINADTANKRSEAEGRDIENKFKPDLLATDLEQGRMNIANTKAAIDVAVATLGEISSRVSLNNEQANEARALASESEIRAANEALRSKGIEANNELIAQQVINAKCDEILKVLEQSLIKAQTSREYAQAKSLNMDVVYKEFQQEFRDTFGANPDQNLWSAATGMLGKASSAVGNAIDSANSKIESGIENAAMNLYKAFKKIVK